MQPRTFTAAQLAVIGQITSSYDIDAERIRFLNEGRPNDPWFPPDVLMSMARQSGKFQSIAERHDQFIPPPLNQVVHQATVIDDHDRLYTRSGAATVGEKLSNGEEIDAHVLAGGRALSATLTAAGFHPLRAASVLNVQSPRSKVQGQAERSHTQRLDAGLAPRVSKDDAVHSRLRDLKRIHAIAMAKGLIRCEGGLRDLTLYRRQLAEWYEGATSAVNFDPIQRASLIQALARLPDVDEFAEVGATDFHG
jgi:hypothetical protein